MIWPGRKDRDVRYSTILRVILCTIPYLEDTHPSSIASTFHPPSLIRCSGGSSQRLSATRPHPQLPFLITPVAGVLSGDKGVAFVGSHCCPVPDGSSPSKLAEVAARRITHYSRHDAQSRTFMRRTYRNNVICPVRCMYCTYTYSPYCTEYRM